MPYCAVCGNTIDKEHPFTDPKSHKEDCKMYVGDRQLAEIIKGKDARHPNGYWQEKKQK